VEGACVVTGVGTAVEHVALEMQAMAVGNELLSGTDAVPPVNPA